MMTIDPEISALLEADRELTPEELRRLQVAADDGWQDLHTVLRDKVRAAYAVSDPVHFRLCVEEHMSAESMASMMNADVFNCPRCGRLLKDTGTPVASAILLERRRLRIMLIAMEALPAGPERVAARRRLFAALGEQAR